MTRASQQALGAPGVRPPHSLLDTKEHRRSILINDPPMNAFTHAEAIDLRLQCNQRPRSFARDLQIWCRNKSRDLITESIQILSSAGRNGWSNDASTSGTGSKQRVPDRYCCWLQGLMLKILTPSPVCHSAQY
ncbi:MAG: hypothetical protein DRR42_07200 [Gammaproteobacteria bacterium]|nr:MAG: hypothetical protein DRR42_07200 [Gammaproteobacteria bacterium]